MSFRSTFPLWVKPWISGIYAFDCHERELRGRRTPAVLTAYLDEVGDATLMMHALMPTRLEGGDIEWNHWAAVRWRGGGTVSLFGLDLASEDPFNLRHKLDLPLSRQDTDDLMLASELFERTTDGSRRVAQALLPHLPFVNFLAIWDGREDLDCIESSIGEFRDSDVIKYVIKRPVLPLERIRRRPDEDDDCPSFEGEAEPLDDVPPVPDPNFIRDLVRDQIAKPRRRNRPVKS